MDDQPARILVVDDAQVNRLVVGQMLKRVPDVSIETTEASTGAEALEILSAKKFELVLMDVQMPGIDGIEATRAVRAGEAGEINRAVQIIAMTAHSGSDDEKACTDAGMTGYLVKPLRLQAFTEAIRAALG